MIKIISIVLISTLKLYWNTLNIIISSHMKCGAILHSPRFWSRRVRTNPCAEIFSAGIDRILTKFSRIVPCSNTEGRKEFGDNSLKIGRGRPLQRFQILTMSYRGEKECRQTKKNCFSKYVGLVEQFPWKHFFRRSDPTPCGGFVLLCCTALAFPSNNIFGSDRPPPPGGQQTKKNKKNNFFFSFIMLPCFGLSLQKYFFGVLTSTPWGTTPRG